MAKKINIAVDIGNTRIKSGEFDGNELGEVLYWNSLMELYSNKKEETGQWMFCTVKGNNQEIHQIFKDTDYHILSMDSPMSISLDYKTPETLGMDRVSALIGAQNLFPDRNILVIDMGTCNTYDILDKRGVFRGGVIAPGFRLRMKAMHHFTKELPDISEEWELFAHSKLGQTTKECLKTGSFDATILEIDGFIDLFQKEFEELSVVLTGGDASHFESKLKGPIFARSNLVLRGLNTVMNLHNAE